MTAASVTAEPHPRDRVERNAVLLTVATVLVALGLGLVLRMAIQSASTSVSMGGVAADVPAGWVVTPGNDDSAFRAVDPRSPATSFNASILTGADAEAAARAQLARDHGLREGFTELSASAIRLGTRDGYRIDYAFVEQGAVGRLPVIKRAAVLFVVDGDRLIGLTYVAPSESWDVDLDRFFQFATSARPAS